MTNSYALDVFMPDGNTYDSTKFHSYADIDTYFMTVEREGKWRALDNGSWQVEGMVLRKYHYDRYYKVSGNISQYGDYFVFSNVNCKHSAKDYIDSTDPTKTATDAMEPSASCMYLIVPLSLISEDRDEALAQYKMTENERRENWIGNQFSIWDGSHKELTKLIKKSLNDEKSFSHIETRYIDVCDTDAQKVANDYLKSLRYTSQVEVGDLFIMETFSAKNLFNATVKNTALGIVKTNDKVYLLGFE